MFAERSLNHQKRISQLNSGIHLDGGFGTPRVIHGMHPTSCNTSKIVFEEVKALGKHASETRTDVFCLPKKAC
jgi:hypothetical protein